MAGHRLWAPDAAVRRAGTAARWPPPATAAAGRAHHRSPAGSASHCPQVRFARKYGHRGVAAGIGGDDLEQIATVGLILAVDRFDPGRSPYFLSFAVPTITGEILRYFRDRSDPIRMPRRLRTLQVSIFDAADELGQRHGRAPRPSEIARNLGVDVEVVLETLQAQQTTHTWSLDEPAAGPGDDAADCGRLDAALGHVEPEFELIENRQALASLLDELSDRERQILLLRFFGGMTQTQIGNRVGISQMHVSRLLARTLSELRRRLAS